MSEQVEWCGTSPEKCELCDTTQMTTFVDGKTKNGWWALMCRDCHKEHGGLTGIGYGQVYDTKTLQCIEGA